ncbi:MAG: PAS domain S-box protein, partial [Candidatus Aenigmarchaeota archaeon]|nr:PAS domain S-box protein [Candidatus Aenigmarchaeota archaeon]
KKKEQLIHELKEMRQKVVELEGKAKRWTRADRALQESEGKYRSLVESTDDSIYLVDRNCRYLFMNRKHLERLGLSEHEHEGRSYSEFHTPDETRFFKEKLIRIIETGESIQFEYQSKRDGRHFFQT